MQQDTLEAKLEFKPGKLADIAPLFVPGTIQEANEIMALRDSMPQIRNEFLWTADFPMYRIEDGEAFLYFAGKEHNLVLRDVENAAAQLISTGNYIPPKEGIDEVVATAAAGKALKIKISSLNLQKHSPNDEYGFFDVNPDNLDLLNEDQRKLVNAIYGTSKPGNMVYILDSEYVKHALKGKEESAIARASGLGGADYGSRFYAGDRDVGYSGWRLARGINKGSAEGAAKN